MLSRLKSSTRDIRAGLPSGVWWMVYSYGLGLLFQAIYFVLLARGLGAAQLGRFGGTLALVDGFAPLVGLGAGSILVKETALNGGQFSRYLGNAVLYIAATSVGFGLAILLAVHAIDAALLSYLPYILVAELLGGRLIDLSLQAFQACDRLHWTAHVFVSAASFRCVAVIAFLGLGTRNLATWSILYMVAVAGAGVGAFVMVGLLQGWPQKGDLRFRSTWREGLGFSIGQGSKTVYADIDKFMLMNNGALSVAGSFTAAYRIVTFVFIPIQAVVYSSNTEMFRAGRQGGLAVWGIIRRLGIPIMGCSLLGAGALVVGSKVAPLVLGRGYGATGGMLVFLLGLPAVQGAHYLFGDILMGMGRQGARGAAQVGVALFNIGANLLLIPRFSWRGAVAATYVGEGGMAALFAIWIWRFYRKEVKGTS